MTFFKVVYYFAKINYTHTLIDFDYVHMFRNSIFVDPSINTYETNFFSPI